MAIYNLDETAQWGAAVCAYLQRWFLPDGNSSVAVARTWCMMMTNLRLRGYSARWWRTMDLRVSIKRCRSAVAAKFPLKKTIAKRSTQPFFSRPPSAPWFSSCWSRIQNGDEWFCDCVRRRGCSCTKDDFLPEGSFKMKQHVQKDGSQSQIGYWGYVVGGGASMRGHLLPFFSCIQILKEKKLFWLLK